MGRKQSFGIIGGLGAIGGADIFFKLVKASPTQSGKEHFDLVFEQHPFEESDAAGSESANANARKLYVFDMMKRFEARRVDVVLLPCFISHT